MKYKFLLVIVFFSAFKIQAQLKYEREFRIKKSQFPTSALQLVEEKLPGIKKVKFYKEIDSSIAIYDVKFKKDRLWYSLEFTKEGSLKDIEVKIKNIDIPEESYERILLFLKQTFTSYKIKKIQQQYVVLNNEKEILKVPFQNLITPDIYYELLVKGKKETHGKKLYKIRYNSEGKNISIKETLPPNYDHTLY
ncbi:hypothetical protein CLV91_1173 [Maribacter vaceletii]|uniref:Uncharacterized protein n=1 Tax=Maribacter vaceletii TaxID=1206816 RepID=A0A495EEL0_9FLAO|nr:hypothetical protein [Maribacter vaceletii]RKR15091.1 hypothetical protein CLV91_1173 [Maribacter vaceletii]